MGVRIKPRTLKSQLSAQEPFSSNILRPNRPLRAKGADRHATGTITRLCVQSTSGVSHLRILLLTHYFRSGQTTHVFALGTALRQLGHDVIIAVGGVRSAARAHYLRTLARGTRLLTQTPRATLIKLARWSDVIHVHSKRSFHLGAQLAEEHGVPLVITCHAASLIRPEYEDAFHCARYIICPWPRLAEQMGPRQGRTVMIPNGIELDRFRFRPRTPGSELRLLLLGRIDHSRLEGFNALCDATLGLQGVRLSVASDYRVKRPEVTYLGWLARPERHLGRSDVVVGTGRAVLEGLATGCAALVLGVGWDGLLTPANASQLSRYNFIGDATGTPPSAPAIREAIVRLQQDLPLRSALGAWGRQYVASHFEATQMARRTASIYAAAKSRAE